METKQRAFSYVTRLLGELLQFKSCSQYLIVNGDDRTRANMDLSQHVIKQTLQSCNRVHNTSNAIIVYKKRGARNDIDLHRLFNRLIDKDVTVNNNNCLFRISVAERLLRSSPFDSGITSDVFQAVEKTDQFAKFIITGRMQGSTSQVPCGSLALGFMNNNDEEAINSIAKPNQDEPISDLPDMSEEDE